MMIFDTHCCYLFFLILYSPSSLHPTIAGTIAPSNITTVTTTEDENPRHNNIISYGRFKSILSSQIDLDIDHFHGKYNNGKIDSKSSEIVWQHALDFEWERMIEKEKNFNTRNNNDNIVQNSSSSSALLFPFLICDLHQESLSKNGLERLIQMKGLLNKTDDYISFYKNVIYNHEDGLCIYATMSVSTSNKIQMKDLVNLSIQPLISATKIRRNSIVSLDDNDGRVQKKNTKITNYRYDILVDITPGVISTKDEAFELAYEFLSRIKNDFVNLRRRKERKNKRQMMRVVSEVEATTNNHTLSEPDSIENEYLWTSPAMMEKLNRVETTTNRRHLTYTTWQSLLEDDSNEHCISLFNDTDDNKSSFIYFTVKEPTVLHNTFQIIYEITSLSSNQKSCINRILVNLSVSSEVLSVENRPPIESHNDIAQWILQSRRGSNNTPWYDAGITGQGQVVQVSDKGLDIDNCYFIDENTIIHENEDVSSATSSFMKDGRVDPTQRKVVQYVPFMDDLEENDGHGTHVCSSIAGKKITNSWFEREGYGNGVAYDAKITFLDAHNLENDQYTIPDISVLFEKAKEANAMVSNASWGSTTWGVYGSRDREVDEALYENPYMTMLTSAGNYADNLEFDQLDILSSVGSPGIAKNILSIGAVESEGDDLGSDGKGSEYVTYFSSRGPTNDGRIKPDLLAPGMYVLSARSLISKVNECDPTDFIFRPDVSTSLDQSGLSFKVGTSQACSLASGIVALVNQHSLDGWLPDGDNNSASSVSVRLRRDSIKAILVNGGTEVSGVNNYPLDFTTPSVAYDEHQGFGLINLSKSLPLKNTNGIGIVLVEKTIAAGETHSKTIDIVNNLNFPFQSSCLNEPLSATLVYSDIPGVSGCARCLINDLDLEIMIVDSSGKKGKGKIYYPNGKSNGMRDTVNNIERRRISQDDVESGDQFVISVRATNLSQANIQYSLVVTGCLRGYVEVEDIFSMAGCNCFECECDGFGIGDISKMRGDTSLLLSVIHDVLHNKHQ